jgi:hypothetical protein
VSGGAGIAGTDGTGEEDAEAIEASSRLPTAIAVATAARTDVFMACGSFREQLKLRRADPGPRFPAGLMFCRA